MSSISQINRFYVPGQYCSEQSVGHLLNQVLSSILAVADARLSEHKLTYVQWIPLYKLLQNGHVGSTPGAMARDLSIDPAALNRSINRLERKGLVRRVRSEHDRRMVHLHLTAEGREVAQPVPEALASVLNDHLAGFSQQEWQTLLQLLTRMQANGQKLRNGSVKK
jgi:DNA-binding MarR family transcriptional regulator